MIEKLLNTKGKEESIVQYSHKGNQIDFSQREKKEKKKDNSMDIKHYSYC